MAEEKLLVSVVVGVKDLKKIDIAVYRDPMDAEQFAQSILMGYDKVEIVEREVATASDNQLK